MREKIVRQPRPSKLIEKSGAKMTIEGYMEDFKMDHAQEAKTLIIYDNMVAAINRCHRTDEIKQLRDKAYALEQYARQAQNVTAERKAINIRVRAERRAGQLLRGLQKSKGGGDQKSDHRVKAKHSDFVQAKQASNISDSQATHWQLMAQMPEEKFEENLANVKKSAGKRKRKRRPKEPKIDPVPDRALWVWGQIKDFERENIFDIDPNVVMKEMLDTMKPDIRRVVPKLIRWLRRFTI